MANFNTHIAVAAVASGLLATAALKLEQVFETEAVLLTFLGTLGGILPDIDLKYSHPSRIIFTFLGIIAACATVFALQAQFSIVELWLSAGLVFLLLRYPVWGVFHHFTSHRGAIHSLAAAAMFGLGTSAIAYHGFQQSALMAWLYGGFVTYGFVVHLALDELYSVDFVGNTVKSSFGSALKLPDRSEWISSSVIVTLTVAFWLSAPPTEALSTLTSSETLQSLYQQLLPADGWFGTRLSDHQ
ncbi:MAG TPA: hydrolase [Gammaproteobacteria bacterium]|nr:hydrolase [Gammaproteobacteria bacterium]